MQTPSNSPGVEEEPLGERLVGSDEERPDRVATIVLVLDADRVADVHLEFRREDLERRTGIERFSGTHGDHVLERGGVVDGHRLGLRLCAVVATPDRSDGQQPGEEHGDHRPQRRGRSAGPICLMFAACAANSCSTSAAISDDNMNGHVTTRRPWSSTRYRNPLWETSMSPSSLVVTS